MPLHAIIFGAIGTLVETSELQRQAFNVAFARADLDWVWDKPNYKEMLKMTGGRNRIRAYAEATETPLSEDAIAALHMAKSAIYQQMIRDDGLQLRPGVAELVTQATDAGIQLAFATTTTPENVASIDAALGEASPFAQFAVITNKGTVANGKPAPDVYEYVLGELGVKGGAALAIEDTAKSVEAAASAGVVCVATPGDYIIDQDLSGAVAVAESGQIADLAWLRSLLKEPTVV